MGGERGGVVVGGAEGEGAGPGADEHCRSERGIPVSAARRRDAQPPSPPPPHPSVARTECSARKQGRDARRRRRERDASSAPSSIQEDLDFCFFKSNRVQS